MLRDNWITVRNWGRRAGARLADHGEAVLDRIESGVYYLALALEWLIVRLVGVAACVGVIYFTINSVPDLRDGFANGIDLRTTLLVTVRLLAVANYVAIIWDVLHVIRRDHTTGGV
ncbi:hypothetical protein NE236_07680 [Actinoallomurus purpureus]|uniref:hypothetical protein n=1 Tax=Actinoallomurus purpureus TaxID=478114 RepID=UPI002093A0B0|nr:hypothetical protein [Actinoallomurus purpureus]MCO6004857.1 hypothetical protein [Actinoallomurus purpureus]